MKTVTRAVGALRARGAALLDRGRSLGGPLRSAAARLQHAGEQADALERVRLPEDRLAEGRVHVCHLVQRLDISGGATRLVGLCNGLDGTRVMVSCLSLMPGSPLTIESLEPRVQDWCLTQRGPLVAQAVEVAQVLERYRVDVLHTHGALCQLVGRGAATLLRRPLELVHSGPSVGQGCAPVTAPRGWADAVRVEHYLAPGRAVAEQMATRLGVGPAAIGLFAPAVDTERFAPATERSFARQRLGLAPGQVVLGSFGDPVRLAGVVRTLRDHGHRVTAVALCREGEQGNHGPVQQLGPTRDVAAVLQALDLLLVAPPAQKLAPSQALLEGFACGVPVVATAVPAVLGLMEDGLHGLLPPPEPADQLAAASEQLVADQELRQQMGRRGRAHVLSHHALERMVEPHQGLYLELGARRPGSPGVHPELKASGGPPEPF